MNTIVSMLLIMICSKMTDEGDRAIAVAVLERLQDPKSLTEANIAEESHTSVRAVKKFSQKLGYPSFAKLRMTLVLTQEVRQIQMKSHLTKTDPEKLLDQIAFLAAEPFSKELFQKQTDIVNTMIYNSSKVVLVGAVFPQALSLHYCEDMLMMKKPVIVEPVTASMDLSRAQENDVYIFLSITGRIYSYFKSEVSSFLSSHQKAAGIGGIGTISDKLGQQKIELPVRDDREEGNTMILLTMQYMKYRYYQVYGSVL